SPSPHCALPHLHPFPTRRSSDLLLAAANEAFPDAGVGRADVVSAYAGLRPLVRHGRGDQAESDISREHEIFVDRDGLISVAGGKDRKSTRLNSSHVKISYAVFRL